MSEDDKRNNQITVCSALLDYYNSECTNHALYILTVALAFVGILPTTNYQLSASSLLWGIFVSTEVYLVLRLLLWALLTNEIMEIHSNTLEDFASLHKEFVQGVEKKAKTDGIPKIVIGFRDLHLRNELILLGLIGVAVSVTMFLIRLFAMIS